MADKKISQLSGSTLPLSGTETLPLVQGGVTVKATAQNIADLAASGLAGTNYIYVMADGTDVENATELSAAYTAAQALSPSATNRITIVCGPGEYNFGSTAFTMSSQYIDLVSLDGNRSVLFNSANAAGTIDITANDVFVKGVDVGTKNFTIAANLNLLKVENCQGSGNYSFGGNGGTASGTFTNCQGGSYSFGGGGTASGTFTNCIGSGQSFGGGGTASGVFTNCQSGGSYSFGGGGTASGTFTNCIGSGQSFGGFYGTASGTFTNCQGGGDSFGGGGGTLTGKLYYCRLTAGSFQTVSGAGITRLCLDGSNVENNQG